MSWIHIHYNFHKFTSSTCSLNSHHREMSDHFSSGELSYEPRHEISNNLTDSHEPVQPPFKLRNLKWGSVSSLTVIEYLSDQQRLWSVCAYAQAGLSLCWSHIPNCWKSHATAHIPFLSKSSNTVVSLQCDDVIHRPG